MAATEKKGGPESSGYHLFHGGRHSISSFWKRFSYLFLALPIKREMNARRPTVSL